MPFRSRAIVECCVHDEPESVEFVRGHAVLDVVLLGVIPEDGHDFDEGDHLLGWLWISLGFGSRFAGLKNAVLPLRILGAVLADVDVAAVDDDDGAAGGPMQSVAGWSPGFGAYHVLFLPESGNPVFTTG